MVCTPVRRDNPRAIASELSLPTGVQTMLYLTCTIISSVDLARYRYFVLYIGHLRVVVQIKMP